MTLPALVMAFVALAAPAQIAPGLSSDCHEWHECRQMALAAHASGQFERFHDLAWRTVQTGPPRDPDLMYMLARAQSLSGRPHDALVMLGRLLDVGFVSDASTNDDFRAVRQLPQWPELEARITPGVPAAATHVPASPTAPPSGATSALGSSSIAGPVPRTDDVLRVASGAPGSTGLAYDRVSARFVVAEGRQRKLVILDERSRQLVDLVTSASAGFYDITAVEIDGARGDLWVVSAEPPGAGRAPGTALHKLQLVSGRPLSRIDVPDDMQPSRLEDVAVTHGGTVLVLDTLGSRILRLSAATRRLTTAASFQFTGATSLAPVDDRIVYVAHASGIARVDLSNGATAPLASPADLALGGFERIRWVRDSLLGIQRLPDGGHRVVRIRVVGGRAAALEIIAADMSAEDGHAATVSGDDFYFLSHQPGASDGEVVVRRARLR